MSLLWHYRLKNRPQPVWTLGGRYVRPRPLVDFAVVGPAGLVADVGLLDTGADDTVLPEKIARQIGIDLTLAPSGSAAGVGLSSIPVRYALVSLRLSDGQEFREWPARVGFTPIPIARPLLGFAGCLQFFTSQFEGDMEQVQLTVNRLYPGT